MSLRLLLALGLIPACGGSVADSTPAAPPLEAPVTVTAPSLSLPGNTHPSHYQVVRANPWFGPALDHRMLPALIAPGTDSERAAAYAAAREEGLTAFAAAEARGETVTAEELADLSEGPRPGGAIRDSFDRVSTDALEVYFRLRTKEIVDGAGVVSERAAALEDLEVVALEAFPWAPGTGKGAAVDIKLVRLGLLEETE